MNHAVLGQGGFIGGFKVPIPGIDNGNESEVKQVVTREIAFTPGIDGGQKVSIEVDVIPFHDGFFPRDQFQISLENSAGQILCTVSLATFFSELILIDQLDQSGAIFTGISFVPGETH